jgi:hypothetical protein
MDDAAGLRCSGFAHRSMCGLSTRPWRFADDFYSGCAWIAPTARAGRLVLPRYTSIRCAPRSVLRSSPICQRVSYPRMSGPEAWNEGKTQRNPGCGPLLLGRRLSGSFPAPSISLFSLTAERVGFSSRAGTHDCWVIERLARTVSNLCLLPTHYTAGSAPEVPANPGVGQLCFPLDAHCVAMFAGSS